MLDNFDKAERQWRERELFRTRRATRPWFRTLLLVATAAALLIWQEETLTWLANLLG